MPQYLSPGVYVEEVDRGSKPIEGVGTAVAGFIGFAEKGPRNVPQLITNWSQYRETFGDFTEGAFLSHAVYGFFNNGGGRCYVVRVDPNGAKAAGQDDAPGLLLPGKEKSLGNALLISAVEPSETAIQVTIEAAKEKPEKNFKITLRKGEDEEVFDDLSMAKGKQYVEAVINDPKTGSKLVRVKDQVKTKTAVAEKRPAFGSFTLKPPPPFHPPAVVEPKIFQGDVAERTGMGGLSAVDEVTMVCLPDLMSAYLQQKMSMEEVLTVQMALINHCENMGDRVAILDSPPGMKPQQVQDWRLNVARFDSKYAALYYPWIKSYDPVTDKNIFIPPSGHMAGIYCRSDEERGVHKAPANEIVRGAIDLEFLVNKEEQASLNPHGINCIRAFPGRGIRVWGARTLSSDPAWRYINVRRLFNFMEKSIELGTQWVVFEPNDMDLWERIKRNIDAFLTRIWRDGALFGMTPDEAFYVKCDAETNPPDVIDVGQVITEIGVAPVKPAEFVVFRISQWQGGAEVGE